MNGRTCVLIMVGALIALLLTVVWELCWKRPAHDREFVDPDNNLAKWRNSFQAADGPYGDARKRLWDYVKTKCGVALTSMELDALEELGAASYRARPSHATTFKGSQD